MVENINIAQADIQSRKLAGPLPGKAQVKGGVKVELVRSNRIYNNAAPVDSSSKGVKIKTPPARDRTNDGYGRANSINDIAGEVNRNLKAINTDLAIEVDSELNQVIFKVVDLETGETIKQIPSEELIRIAKRLKFMIENYSNNTPSSTPLFMDSASFA